VAEAEFDIQGERYRAGNLTPMIQFHILRRLGAPLAAMLGSYLTKKATPGELMIPVMEAMSQLPDDSAEYIVRQCLSVVTRHQRGSEGWAPVQAAGGQVMFADINMMVMMSLTFKVMEVQLDSFFPSAARPGSSAAPAGNGRASPEVRTG
jgi:hypothetical protein